MDHINVTIGDITRARTDAIINAANRVMLGGGGVDGALHLAAGPALLEACRRLPEIGGVRCPTGEARITGAGELAADYVIHAVGPRYAVDPDPPALLAGAYRNSLRLALDYNCRSVAAPAISCGIFGYPLEEAAHIALDTSAEADFRGLAITFYLYSQDVFDVWNTVLTRLRNQPGA